MKNKLEQPEKKYFVLTPEGKENMKKISTSGSFSSISSVLPAPVQRGLFEGDRIFTFNHAEA